MPASEPSPLDDLALLVAAARAVGPILKDGHGRDVQTWSKGKAGPVTEVDLAANAVYERMVRAARPGYGWLSEEGPDDPDRLTRRRAIIVDPLDGTQAFLDKTHEFCTAIGVVEDGRPIAGVVYNPMTEELFAAARGAGATLNGAPVRVSGRDVLEGAHLLGAKGQYRAARWPKVKRSQRAALAYRIALIANQFDGVVTLGWKHEWDICAASLVVEEAGGVVTDLEGQTLIFNKTDPRSHGAVAAGPGLHPLLIETLRTTRGSGA